MPPWISLELRLDVPAAQSLRSTSATRRPRSAASRATPAPVIPPPTTSRSSSAEESAERVASRVSAENGEAMSGRRLAGGPQLGQRRLRLGDLVSPPLVASDLERAARERHRLGPLATCLARPGQRQARGDRVRVPLDDFAQHRFTPLRVAAEEARHGGGAF